MRSARAADTARSAAATAERAGRDAARVGDNAQAALERLAGQREHLLERAAISIRWPRRLARRSPLPRRRWPRWPIRSRSTANFAPRARAATAAGEAVAEARARSATRARETAADRERHAAAGREAVEWRERASRAPSGSAPPPSA